MHIVNLGIDLWVTANTMKTLLLEFGQDELWPGVDEDGRLASAWNEFKGWARERKIQYPACDPIDLTSSS